jgi:hypothetical protein
MKRFTKSDLKFLKSVGIATKGMRAAKECRLDCGGMIFDPPIPEPRLANVSYAEDRLALAQRIAKHPAPTKAALAYALDELMDRIRRAILNMTPEQVAVLRKTLDDLEKQ